MRDKNFDFKKENDKILLNLKKEDIKSGTEITAGKKTFGRFASAFFYVLCSLLLLYGVSKVAFELISYRKADNIYQNIRDAFYNGTGFLDNTKLGYLSKPDNVLRETKLVTDSADKISVENDKSSLQTDLEIILPNIQRLKNINKNAFGWIKIEGTRVDYPVMQGNDNEFYLSHGPDRSYLISGSIFLDCNNSQKIKNNRNTCVYGHNMSDGTMFQTIMNFKDKKIFDSCKIEFLTSDGIYLYTPFSAYEAEAEYNFFQTDFYSDQEFLSFVDSIKQPSMHYSAITPGAGDKIITLMTCTNSVINKRFVVHGILSEYIEK